MYISHTHQDLEKLVIEIIYGKEIKPTKNNGISNFCMKTNIYKVFIFIQSYHTTINIVYNDRFKS